MVKIKNDDKSRSHERFNRESRLSVQQQQQQQSNDGYYMLAIICQRLRACNNAAGTIKGIEFRY